MQLDVYRRCFVDISEFCLICNYAVNLNFRTELSLAWIVRYIYYDFVFFGVVSKACLVISFFRDSVAIFACLIVRNSTKVDATLTVGSGYVLGFDFFAFRIFKNEGEGAIYITIGLIFDLLLYVQSCASRLCFVGVSDYVATWILNLRFKSTIAIISYDYVNLYWAGCGDASKITFGLLNHISISTSLGVFDIVEGCHPVGICGSGCFAKDTVGFF